MINMLVALVMCVCPVLAQVPREMPTAVEQHFIPRSRERDGKSDPRVGLSRELVPDLRPLVTKTLVPASLIETISRIASRSKNLLNYLNAARDVFAPNEGQSLVWANNEIKVFGETAGSLRKSISQNHKLAASRVEANKLLELGASLDEFVPLRVPDKRTQAEWEKIRQDLRAVARSFGFRQSPFYYSR